MGRINRRSVLSGMGVMLGSLSQPLFAMSRVKKTHYDYIIVGAGSAGSVLAARLAEKPGVKVLLLEAGGPAENPLIDNPLKWFFLLGSGLVYPDMSTPQVHAANKQLFAVHGKVIGGSSTINAMIHHRPTPADIDNWNLPGWRWNDLAPMFEKSESFQSKAMPGRGSTGPIKVSVIPDPPELALASLAASKALGWGVSDDINGKDNVGAALNQLAYDGTHRYHTGRAYLSGSSENSGLTVMTSAIANKLTFDGSRCSGVEYSVNGVSTFSAAEKVIVCSGALRTPQLLMQSGIGPADHLKENDINPQANLPGVGENLHDHVLVSGNNFSTPTAVNKSNYHGSVSIFYGSKEGTDNQRNIMMNISTSPNVLEPLESPKAGFKSSFSFTKPKSRGTLRLDKSDPTAAPLIDHNIFSDSYDVDGLLSALHMSRTLFKHDEFKPFNSTEANSTLLSTPKGRKQFLIDGATSFGHHCGTCKMGSDDLSVVDENLKVHETDGLYVMDASVIPEIPSSPTNPLVIAMAELFAEKIQS